MSETICTECGQGPEGTLSPEHTTACSLHPANTVEPGAIKPEGELRLYRVGIRHKETDKRKNATCYEYVCMATSTEGAKALAVAEHMGRGGPERLLSVAAVGCHAMGLVYQSDIYHSKKKELLPETMPEGGLVEAAWELIQAFEDAHAHEDEDANPQELTKNPAAPR